jgi:hypothetical protein
MHAAWGSGFVFPITFQAMEWKWFDALKVKELGWAKAFH